MLGGGQKREEGKEEAPPPPRESSSPPPRAELVASDADDRAVASSNASSNAASSRMDASAATSKAEEWSDRRLLISGMRVRARWKGLMVCNGTIVNAHEDGSCDIQYDDGDYEPAVPDVEPHEEQPNPAVRRMIEEDTLRREEELLKREAGKRQRQASGEEGFGAGDVFDFFANAAKEAERLSQ
ncbi:unnamed protein product, partial [Amoebophrya sp. A25]|eukprot:GSA25T00024868001.1